MKLYLINILQSNELEQVKGLAPLIEEFKADLLQSTIEDAMKYLCQLVFTNPEDREKFADKIQHIAFEFNDIEYDEKLYEAAKQGKIKVNYEEKPKHYKPSKWEIKIDSWLEKRGIKFKKTYLEYIMYELSINEDCDGMINLAYKGNWLQGAVAEGNLIVCQQKQFMDRALQDIFKEIETIDTPSKA